MGNSLSRNLGLLQSGSVVTLDVSTSTGQKRKFRSTFVGYLLNQYVLIQFPESGKVGDFSNFITQGTGVTVRGLVEGHEASVVAFVSTIKQTLQIPSRLIVLDFPNLVNIINLRSSVRIETLIDSRVKVGQKYWQSTITDLSINGCHLTINDDEVIALAGNETLEVIIEDFAGLQNIKVKGVICNNKQEVSGVSFGVKFLPESKKAVTSLLHFAVTLEN
jgi:hypothetical protein